MTRRRVSQPDTARIVRTAHAEEDLIDIWASIPLVNWANGDRALDAVERMTRLVARYQNFGRERSTSQLKGRGVAICSYAILHRILGDEVELVRYVRVRRQFMDCHENARRENAAVCDLIIRRA
ncbi:MAG: hypothetical protein ACRD33_07685 [Candidatus Acidiferrales bacterium]